MLASHLFPVAVKAKTKALKYTHGLVVTKAQAEKAALLARNIERIRPGVFQVGNSIADLWRLSCTCKTARATSWGGKSPKEKPCIHFLALYYNGDWSPLVSGVEYYQSIGMTQPEIAAVPCKAKKHYRAMGNAPEPVMVEGKSESGLYLVIQASEYHGFFTAQDIDSKRFILLRREDITHLSVIYS